MSVTIIVDSTSSIPNHYTEQLPIEVVQLSVNFKNQSYKENEISNDDFFNLLSEVDYLPTSSQPSLEDLYNTFEKIILKGDKIIAVFLSDKMSGTYESSHIVKEMIVDKYPNAEIQIINSLSTSMQLGSVAIAAAEKSLETDDLKEITRYALNNRDCSRFIFIPDTLKYLEKGGRIGKANALLGNLLKIKPILTVDKDGYTDVITKIRSKKQAIKKMIEILNNDITSYGIGDVVVHHINCIDDARKFANEIESIISKKVQIVDITPVVGMHVGPGAIGISYYTQQPIQ